MKICNLHFPQGIFSVNFKMKIKLRLNEDQIVRLEKDKHLKAFLFLKRSQQYFFHFLHKNALKTSEDEWAKNVFLS